MAKNRKRTRTVEGAANAKVPSEVPGGPEPLDSGCAGDCKSHGSGRPSPGSVTSSGSSRMSGFFWRGILQNAAGFVAIFVVLWLGVDVGLIYHGGGVIPEFPAFYWGWDFARESLARPGGVSDYLSSLLMQSLFFSWYGALLLTLQSVVLFVSARRCVQALDLPGSGLLGFIAPLLLLGIHVRYGHEAQAVMALTLALAVLGLYTLIPSDRTGIRWVALVLGTALLYPMAAGAGAVFSLTVALLEWRRSGGRWMSVGALVLGVVLPLMEGWLFFGFAPEEVLASLLPVTRAHLDKHPRGVIPLFALYCLLPMLGLGALAKDAWRKWRSRRASTETQEAPVSQPKTRPAESKHPRRDLRNAGRTPSPGTRWFDGAWRGGWVAQTVLSGALVIGVFLAAHDQRLKTVLAVDYFASQGMWSNVLEETARHPLRDPSVACTSVQATFHLGRLTSQLPGVDSPEDLLLANGQPSEFWKMSGLCLDLGLVNLALHNLTESVEIYGERPLLLRGLATANLAISNIPTARIYLNVLTKVPFHSQWARDYLHRLETDPSLGTDKEIARLRNLMVKRDVVGPFAPDDLFALLLGACPQNRMAFEYRMTYRLLSKNLRGFAQSVRRVQDFPGFEVPPLWQEALILFSREQQMPAAEVKARFNPDLIQRLDRILQAYEANGRDAAATWNQFRSQYANSYFLYYLCHP
jgi:hypothetical protein